MKRPGFTLLEMMVVCAIILMLCALIFAALWPAREKGREAACSLQMHQWGQAFAMYISDYDGVDPVVGTPMSHAQLGLPPFAQTLAFVKTYKIWDTALMRCPSDHRRPTLEMPKVPLISYELMGLVSEDTRPGDTLPQLVAMRGPEYPLIGCDQHNTDINWYDQPTWATKRVLVLRIDQHLDARTIQADDVDGMYW